MPYIDNQGVAIHYRLVGKGEPLVMMHNSTGCIEDWVDFGYVSVLSEGYQCVLIDARGHGKSDKPLNADAYDIIHNVADVVGVMDKLNIESAHYLGYSRGGWVGFGMAKYALSRCKSLMLGGAQPYRTSALVSQAVCLLEQGMPTFVEYIERRYGALSPQRKKRLLESDSQALRYSLMKEREDLSDALTQICVSVLLYCAEKDPLLGQAKRACDTIRGAHWLALSEMNHIQVIERGDVVAPYLLKFLSTCC